MISAKCWPIYVLLYSFSLANRFKGTCHWTYNPNSKTVWTLCKTELKTEFNVVTCLYWSWTKRLSQNAFQPILVSDCLRDALFIPNFDTIMC